MYIQELDLLIWGKGKKSSGITSDYFNKPEAEMLEAILVIDEGSFMKQGEYFIPIICWEKQIGYKQESLRYLSYGINGLRGGVNAVMFSV